MEEIRMDARAKMQEIQRDMRYVNNPEKQREVLIQYLREKYSQTQLAEIENELQDMGDRAGEVR